MRLAVMQPYAFPYIGYFQLVHAVDTFVFYDDINYIKNGWINRNRLRLGGQVRYFTIPLADASPFRRIDEIRIDDRQPWRRKVTESLRHAYRRAPHFEPVQQLVETVLNEDAENIGAMARNSVISVASYLGLPTRFVSSSRQYGNDHLRGVDRVLDICRREGATEYLNPPGGRALYPSESFECQGIALQFIEPAPIEYPQLGEPFEPWLSIIDVLMHNAPPDVRALLTRCRIAP